MTPESLYEHLLNLLQPNYEKAFGKERRKDLMNISSLVSGTRSYIYHWKERGMPHERHQKISIALLRGAGIHALINQKVNDTNPHEITWKLPYDWKDGTKDITLIGHYDNTILLEGNTLLIEWKTTEQEDINKNGLLLRAKRQIGTYAKILQMKTGVAYEVFVVIINSDIHVVKLTPEEIDIGFAYVKITAYNVAKELDVSPELPAQ